MLVPSLQGDVLITFILEFKVVFFGLYFIILIQKTLLLKLILKLFRLQILCDCENFSKLRDLKSFNPRAWGVVR